MSFTLDLDDECVAAMTNLINERSDLLLCIPQVRELITFMRLKAAEKVDGIEGGDAVYDHTITHNLNSLSNGLAQQRPSLLFSALTGIEYIKINTPAMNLLIIGPRSENEIFCAYAAGFKPENVHAIDLLSYSELVQLGDMHDLPFEDDTFDVVVAGWVLAYSADNEQAAKEMLRVCKPQGHIAVGCVAEVWEPSLADDIAAAVGGVKCTSDDPERPGKTKTVSRYWTSDQILRLFKGHIDALIVDDEPHPATRNKRMDLLTVFRIK